MKIVFRVRYQTVPGQSLWLLLTDQTGREEALPMCWLNAEQWELERELESSSFRYRYQLREEGNGLQLDEWGDGREVFPGAADCLWLADTWRSAGTIDCACQSLALQAMLPQRGPFSKAPAAPRASHRFTIRVAAVPQDLALCLIGNPAQLGGWDPSSPVVMEEVAADLWQADVELAAAQDMEYKYGFCRRDSGELVEYELGDNRQLEAHVICAGQLTWIQDENYRRDESSLFRGAGVAIPVFSLRSEQGLGVGEFADLPALADWAQPLGLQMIQILPIHDTTAAHDWTDSYPYSAISCFALHPIYLRIDALDCAMPADWAERLEARRLALNALGELDYEAVMSTKLELTREVFERHRERIASDPEVTAFIEQHRGWLLAYAAFCVLRDQHGTGDFTRWGGDARFTTELLEAMWREGSAQRREMEYWIWLQHELDGQLAAAVGHLHASGVVLKGDLPIGIDRASVEAWSAPELFHLDAQSGAPPDFFSAEGQNWGFPTYNWQRMREDGYAWWQARLSHLARYFDAFRIDHILGFFRIWQIPIEQVDGLRGWFEPALPVHLNEFRERGVDFDPDRFCKPWLTRGGLEECFGELVDEVISEFLQVSGEGRHEFQPAFDTQRKVAEHFAGELDERAARIRKGLLACHGEVLFFEAPGSSGTAFHPRFCLQRTRSFADLDEAAKERVDAIYNDYFFKRQDFQWRAGGLQKLDALRRASDMLLCGEDLGMVPECVPGAMRDLGILSLEIQRMPKTYGAEFDDPRHAPYLSVVSPSTHDMPNLREWWQAYPDQAKRLAWTCFSEAHPEADLDVEMAAHLLRHHFESPAMWAVIPLQDVLALDEVVRHPDPTAERINDPSIMPHNWRYRMHLTLADLAAAGTLKQRIAGLLEGSGRSGTGDA